ncbi:MAG: outer membrane lipoprotein-sorting protein [Pseudomonadota bacterium]
MRRLRLTARQALALVAIVLPLGLCLSAAKADPGTKGFDVAARSDRSDVGFGDSRVALQMILTNAAGATAVRELEITTLERENEDVGDKSLVHFSEPRDIDGTALLSHAKILDADDQWLYLPALKRVKRISSSNKSGPFVGSEFAFEDITAQELNKFSYTWLQEEPCGALTCDVVERTPLYEGSGYTKQIAWYDQTDFQIRKVEYYDRKGALLKTQLFEDYRTYPGGVWRSHLFRMENHQTGKKTDLKFEDYRFGVGLDDGDFVKGTLRRL